MGHLISSSNRVETGHVTDNNGTGDDHGTLPENGTLPTVTPSSTDLNAPKLYDPVHVLTSDDVLWYWALSWD